MNSSAGIHDGVLDKVHDEVTTDVDAAPSTNDDHNSANKNARIQNLLNLFQGIPQRHPSDEELIKRGEMESGRSYTELDIRESDWDDLIRNGLTWNQLESFIVKQLHEPLIVGPLCLRRRPLHDDQLSDPMYFNGICFHRVIGSYMDSEVKVAFRSIMRLLYVKGSCEAHSDSIFLEWALDCDVKFRSCVLNQIKNIRAEVLAKCFQHPHLESFEIHRSSFNDDGAFCQGLACRKFPLNTLNLSYTDIDASMLPLALQSTDCVRNLSVSNWTSNFDWDLLTKAMSGMKNLTSVSITGYAIDPSWFRGLSALMQSKSLERIHYGIQFNPPAMCWREQVKVANQVLGLLKVNSGIFDLKIPTLDEQLWHATIEPILVERRIARYTRSLADATPTNAAFLLTGFRFQYPKIHHTHELFEVLVRSNATVKALWDYGRREKEAKKQKQQV